MPCLKPARLAALCAAACLAASGCGSNSSPTGGASLHAPRRLQLPANVRPIPIDVSNDSPAIESHLAPAQYQQSPAAPASPQPRILEVSTPAENATRAAIREPAAGLSSVAASPASPPRRSEFVPITVPEPSIPSHSSSPPQLPAEPTFSAPQAARIPATTQGPLLTQPGEPISIASSPESAQARDKNIFPAQPTAPPAIQNAASPQNSPGMQVVAQRAMQIADQAAAMAQRGMLYSAQSELIQALQLVAQSLDAEQGTTRHAAALAAGLTALAEARDFSAQAIRSGEAMSVASIAATHRTSLFGASNSPPTSPVVAQQQYFAHAQSQLTLAAGNIPAASQILYRLGRLQTAVAAHDADPLALHAPKSIVFHQASLATDGGNWLAANELGVLYARYGQLSEAKRFLLHSVTLRPHVEGWQNLAVVHRRLGETDLAERAERERQLLATKPASAANNSAEMIRWVDPKSFAASGGPDVKWPPNAAQTVAASPGAARR
jgi:tetratricopeptide (TPR) repeat protein